MRLALLKDQLNALVQSWQQQQKSPLSLINLLKNYQALTIDSIHSDELSVFIAEHFNLMLASYTDPNYQQLFPFYHWSVTLYDFAFSIPVDPSLVNDYLNDLIENYDQTKDILPFFDWQLVFKQLKQPLVVSQDLINDYLKYHLSCAKPCTYNAWCLTIKKITEPRYIRQTLITDYLSYLARNACNVDQCINNLVDAFLGLGYCVYAGLNKIFDTTWQLMMAALSHEKLTVHHIAVVLLGMGHCIKNNALLSLPMITWNTFILQQLKRQPSAKELSNIIFGMGCCVNAGSEFTFSSISWAKIFNQLNQNPLTTAERNRINTGLNYCISNALNHNTITDQLRSSTSSNPFIDHVIHINWPLARKLSLKAASAPNAAEKKLKSQTTTTNPCQTLVPDLFFKPVKLKVLPQNNSPSVSF